MFSNQIWTTAKCWQIMVWKKTSESKPVTACRKEKQTRNQNYARHIYTHFYKTRHWQQVNLPTNSSLLNKVYLMQMVTCIFRRSAYFILLPHKQKHFYCTIVWSTTSVQIWSMYGCAEAKDQLAGTGLNLSTSAGHTYQCCKTLWKQSTPPQSPEAKSPECLKYIVWIKCLYKVQNGSKNLNSCVFRINFCLATPQNGWITYLK